MTYIQNNNPEIRVNSPKVLNDHLKAIRLQKEPNKPVSNSIEKNAAYIQEKYNWKEDVVSYFKSLRQ